MAADDRSTIGPDAPDRQLRYAVVGLGHIAQATILPAFRHAERSQLAALVSGDPTKRKKLGKKYKTPAFAYEQLAECLAEEAIDAVFIAVPNDRHAEFTIAAAEAGVHVLCEKPMAVTCGECRQMIEAARRHHVKLMIAYRLHFEEANLKALEIVQSGQLGQPRLFSSVFSMSVKDGNIRLQAERGGGTLYDIGIYCINAARTLFRAEPTEVLAQSLAGRDPRFREVDEMTAAVLTFPGDRLAAFSTSFGAADVSSYRILGTAGSLLVERAYEYSERITHYLTTDGKTRRQVFAKRDQFAAEITYFSRCVLDGADPEPSGEEGLADVRVIEALYESARTGQSVRLPRAVGPMHPTPEQEIHEPPGGEPSELVHVESPSY